MGWPSVALLSRPPSPSQTPWGTPGQDPRFISLPTDVSIMLKMGVPVLLRQAAEAWGSGRGNPSSTFHSPSEPLGRCVSTSSLLSDGSSQDLPSRAIAKSHAVLIPAEPWRLGMVPSALLLLLSSDTSGPAYSRQQKWDPRRADSLVTETDINHIITLMNV